MAQLAERRTALPGKCRSHRLPGGRRYTPYTREGIVRPLSLRRIVKKSAAAMRCVENSKKPPVFQGGDRKHPPRVLNTAPAGSGLPFMPALGAAVHGLSGADKPGDEGIPPLARRNRCGAAPGAFYGVGLGSLNPVGM